jgi:hypothetical protein
MASQRGRGQRAWGGARVGESFGEVATDERRRGLLDLKGRLSTVVSVG